MLNLSNLLINSKRITTRLCENSCAKAQRCWYRVVLLSSLGNFGTLIFLQVFRHQIIVVAICWYKFRRRRGRGFEAYFGGGNAMFFCCNCSPVLSNIDYFIS